MGGWEGRFGSGVGSVGEVDGLLFVFEVSEHGGEAGAFAGNVVGFLQVAA